MLSIGKLAAGEEAYYLGKVAEGIEDYYVGGGEAEGRWTGSGAAALGLEGSVSSDQLQAMLAAKNPVTGQPLQDREQTMNGPGFDLTFSAPKSVSGPSKTSTTSLKGFIAESGNQSRMGSVAPS